MKFALVLAWAVALSNFVVSWKLSFRLKDAEKRAAHAEDVISIVESLGEREALAVSGARKLLEIPSKGVKS